LSIDEEAGDELGVEGVEPRTVRDLVAGAVRLVVRSGVRHVELGGIHAVAVERPEAHQELAAASDAARLRVGVVYTTPTLYTDA
jgi:hypothetical protein